MNFKTLLLTAPLLLTTVACGGDRIVTTINPLGGDEKVTVNCTEKTILEDDKYDSKWVTREDYPGFEGLFDMVMKEICN